MNMLAVPPGFALDVPRGVVSLTGDELDDTIGGSPDPMTLGALVFVVSVVIGIIDRILFGGCRCRNR